VRLAQATDGGLDRRQYDAAAVSNLTLCTYVQGGANDFAEPLTPNGAMKKSSKVRG